MSGLVTRAGHPCYRRGMINGPKMTMAFKVAAKAPAPIFAEQAVVHLAHDVEVGAETMPAGSSGIIVAVHADGTYDVRFEAPFAAVTKLEGDDLRA